MIGYIILCLKVGFMEFKGKMSKSEADEKVLKYLEGS